MHIRDVADMERVLREFDSKLGPFLTADDARARKRRRIVEAATAMFIRHGYRKASIDEVAAEAGIAKGTVYLYFKTKTELLLAAVLVEKMGYMARMRPLFERGIGGRERLRRLISMSVTISAEMPLTSRLLGGDRDLMAAMSEMDPAVLRASEVLQLDFMADLVAEATGVARPTEAVRERARVLMGLLVSALLVGERARYGLPVDRYAAALADVLVDGAAPASERHETVAAPARAARRRRAR
jgi:AcrR family transcriptional regulator